MKYLVAVVSIVFSFFSLPAWSQDWYEIEVLIFEHASNPYEKLSDPERWPSDISLAWPSPLMELDPPSTEDEGAEEIDGAAEDYPVPKPYLELPSDQRRLSNANYAMRVRDQYNLLWHKSWKAPLLPEEDSPWVLVEAGEQIGEHYRLEGAIRVHLTRYLHLHSDLWLTELQPFDAEEQTEFHWSQLPKPEITRWPCIFVEEDWPDAARELPEEYYEKPAPGEWYYPFGCGVEPVEADPFVELSEEVLSDLPIALPVELIAAPQILSSTEELDSTNSTVDINTQTGTQTTTEAVASDTTPEKPSFYGISMFGIAGEEEAEEGALSNQTPILTSQAEILEGAADEIDPRSQTFSDTSAYPVQQIIHIQSRRRMRSEELHYVDHPKIGILAIIHPVEQPVLEAKPIEYISAPLPTNTVGQPSESTTE